MSTLFAFLHHLAAFTLVAALAIEFTLIRQDLTVPSARRLIATDAVYGVSAGLVLVVGLLRVFYFEKGAEYYWSNHAFLTKFALFILIGALSAVPTIEFLSWRKTVRTGAVPVVSAGKMRTMRMIMHVEMLAIVIILLMAAMMARGGFV